MAEVRVDKYLFAMRLYKTRSVAAEACKKGHIQRGGIELKPAHTLREGDVFTVRKNPVTYTFRVLKLSENRLGAKLVPEFLENLTTPDQLELLEVVKLDKGNRRAKGLGRPTKKERRDLDNFFESENFFVDIE